jgi:hypothetical protein
MKQYELRKEKEGNYTVYRNLNESLKAEIANFKVDTSTVSLGWPPIEWTIQERDGNEFKCVSGRDVKYINVNDVEEAIEEKLTTERNKKFQAYQHFTKTFGVISNLREYEGKPWRLSILDIKSATDMGALVGMESELDTTSVNFYSSEFQYEFDTYHTIGIKMNLVGTSMCLYFTPEGDFINRDYNVDLSSYETKTISPTIMLEHLKSEIFKKVGNTGVVRKGNKFFTDKYCFIPYNKMNNENQEPDFGVKIIPVRHDGKSYQIESGHTIHKRPEKIDQSSPEELWKELEKSLTPLQKCLLSDEFLNFREFVDLEKAEA